MPRGRGDAGIDLDRPEPFNLRGSEMKPNFLLRTKFSVAATMTVGLMSWIPAQAQVPLPWWKHGQEEWAPQVKGRYSSQDLSGTPRVTQANLRWPIRPIASAPRRRNETK